MKDLYNKVVAITGAASGIGRALAQELSRHGCVLALSDVDESGLAETIAGLPKEIVVSSHRVDVSHPESIYQWADDVVNLHGCVDIVINNAGVASVASIEEITLEDFDWVFNICFYGVLHGTKAFLPYLKQQNEGHIVNISSVNGFVPFPNNGPYNCAKHAVKALNQTLIQELRGSSVKVMSVHPGGIKTNIARNSRVLGAAAENDGARRLASRFDRVAGTTSERTAALIVRGIQKDKKRILVGKDAVVMDFLTRLFPQRFSDYVGQVAMK
ncbi:acetoin dehydrogenase [Gammaproteobacteria bacterium 45_16_T64]|nr:acetoin dehydrogenase [Gammaproteobacteria bacterium 45_16_T64]